MRGTRRALFELFLASFLILFFELTCIRWFGSIVLFLTFFTNVVLMACFLGVSVGCLSASRRGDFIQGFIPGTLLAVGLAYAVLWSYFRFDSRLMIDVGGQRSPQLIYFGADSRVADPARLSVPVEAIAGVFFVLIALVFVGPGQVVGRRFAAIPDRLAAYTADILGSLAGIAAFGAASLANLPSTAWFAFSLALGLYFTPRRRWLHAAAALATLYIVATRIDWPETPPGREAHNSWSPYNFVSYKAWHRGIDVNNLAHQRMLAIEEGGAAYMLPYLLNRDAGGPPFEDVLIIGAGSGNDVAAALRQGAGTSTPSRSIPSSTGWGGATIPIDPIADPRVTIHLDDGRGFVRRTARQYDLDHLRAGRLARPALELFKPPAGELPVHRGGLPRRQCPAQARRRVRHVQLLPPGLGRGPAGEAGGGGLRRAADRVFPARPGDDPRRATTSEASSPSCSPAAPGTPRVEAIRARLARDRSFWLNTQPDLERVDQRLRAGAAAVAVRRPAASARPRRNSRGSARPGWTRRRRPHPDRRLAVPLPARAVDPGPEPPRDGDRGGAIAGDPASCSRRSGGRGPTARCSSWAPGFMLLETKGVVHMALLFGATWMVNSIVFFAILTMVLLGNLSVMALEPRRLWPYYALLLIALAVNALVPMSDFLSLSGPSKVIVSCLVVFVPVFFAGVIFATAFREQPQPDVDFGSNIGGIILGGLSENLSLVLGFNHLLWVAIGYYVLSALLAPRDGV